MGENPPVSSPAVSATKHGVPVAVLQLLETERKRNPAEVISEVREFRVNYSLKELSLKDMIEEGRS